MPSVISTFDTSKPANGAGIFPTIYQPVDNEFNEMEDCTQPSPVVHQSFLISAIKHSDHSEGFVPAATVSSKHQNASQLEFFPNPVAPEVIVSACKLEMYQFTFYLIKPIFFVINFRRDLNAILDECEQDHDYVSFNSKLTV